MDSWVANGGPRHGKSGDFVGSYTGDFPLDQQAANEKTAPCLAIPAKAGTQIDTMTVGSLPSADLDPSLRGDDDAMVG